MKLWKLVLIVFVILAAVFCLVWPGGAATGWGWDWKWFYEKNEVQAQTVSTDVVVQPTRDPMIEQLATAQAEQAKLLADFIAESKQTPVAKDTQVVSKGTTEPAVTSEKQVKEVQSNWPLKLFQTPVKCEKSFNEASSWIICEPGILLDNTTAWTIPGTKDTWYVNVPEGAFTYFSLGQGTITVDGYALNLPYEEGHNYLVLIRGKIDDGKVDTDRNLTAEVTDFVPGHAIWSYMPKGAYVSMDWFNDQLVASTTEGYTNCGALGCSHVTVVLFDVDTHFEQRFAVQADDLSNWTQIK